jgi:hypothetical protein
VSSSTAYEKYFDCYTGVSRNELYDHLYALPTIDKKEILCYVSLKMKSPSHSSSTHAEEEIMRKVMLMSTLLLLFILAIPVQVSAGLRIVAKASVDSQTVQGVSTAVANGVNKKKMLLWKQYQAPYSGYQAVITMDGKRYTIYISNRSGLPDSTNLDLISIWVRPEGTTGQKVLTTWTDYNFDGSVDWALGPLDWGTFGSSEPLDFRSDTSLVVLNNKGPFQLLHNDTIIKLAMFFQKK